MVVELYKNNSENNAINKTLSLVATLEVIFKNDSSIIAPVLYLETSEDLTGINYLKIPNFNRCYFIDNISGITGGRYMINGSIDVLESYKNDILNLSCIVDKQQNIGNMYFDDGSFKVTSKEFLQTYNFPNGFNENGEFILITCGG